MSQVGQPLHEPAYSATAVAEVKNMTALQLLMFAVMSCQGTITFFFSFNFKADMWQALVNAVTNLWVP